MSAKQTAIDARLAALQPQVFLLQDNYLSNFGKNFQGLASHAAIPDGETAMPVDLTVHPGDQTHTYADFWRGVYLSEPEEQTGEREELYQYSEADLADVASLSVRLRFDVCCGPDGWSWTLTLDYEDGSGHWAKIVNKDGVVTDWHLVEPEPEV